MAKSPPSIVVIRDAAGATHGRPMDAMESVLVPPMHHWLATPNALPTAQERTVVQMDAAATVVSAPTIKAA